MNTRNILIAIGLVSLLSGAALGSGAFTQVQADRTASFSVTADSNSNTYVQLEGDGNYVSQSGGTVEFQLNNLNENAVTEVAAALNVTINAKDSTSKWVYLQVLGSGDTVLSSTPVDFETSGGTSVVGTGSAQKVSSGGTLSLDLVVDTTGSTSTSLSSVKEVRIVANQSQP